MAWLLVFFVTAPGTGAGVASEKVALYKDLASCKKAIGEIYQSNYELKFQSICVPVVGRDAVIN